MGYGRQELAVAVASEGLRPLLPPGGSPPGFEQLLQICWHRDPAARPTMAQAEVMLEDIRAALPAWLQSDPQRQQRSAYCHGLTEALVGAASEVREGPAGGIDGPSYMETLPECVAGTSWLDVDNSSSPKDTAQYRPTISAGQS